MNKKKKAALVDLKAMLDELDEWFPNLQEESKARGSMTHIWRNMFRKVVEILDEP